MIGLYLEVPQFALMTTEFFNGMLDSHFLRRLLSSLHLGHPRSTDWQLRFWIPDWFGLQHWNPTWCLLRGHRYMSGFAVMGSGIRFLGWNPVSTPRRMCDFEKATWSLHAYVISYVKWGVILALLWLRSQRMGMLPRIPRSQVGLTQALRVITFILKLPLVVKVILPRGCPYMWVKPVSYLVKSFVRTQTSTWSSGKHRSVWLMGVFPVTLPRRIGSVRASLLSLMVRNLFRKASVSSTESTGLSRGLVNMVFLCETVVLRSHPRVWDAVPQNLQF